MLDAIVLSDLHLGSDNCQAKRICHLLQQVVDGDIATSRIILNGDVFDSIDFRRLTKNHWKVLSLIRKLSDQLEIIWICGNHDGSAEIVSHLLGVSVVDEYHLNSGGRRVLLLHGHQFDDFIIDHPTLTWIADRIYNFLQRIDKTHHLAKVAKKGSKTFLRCVKQVEERALRYAGDQGFDAVCCGHTHHAISTLSGPVHYHNSGCWTELPCNYLTIEEGHIRLNHFQSDVELETVEANPVSIVPAT